jgi:MFS family permease
MATAAEPPYPARAVAWYATLVLALLYWLSIFDRFIINLLVGPMKRDLGLSDVQFGWLNGFGFSLTFAFFGLLAGVLVDRHSRRWVAFGGVAIWSIATAACALAQNFPQLMVARFGVGAGEAALVPAATSMITDLFPRQRLGTAITGFNIGSTIGAGFAFAFGGAIVEAVSHSASIVLPLAGVVRSWQAVFFLLGVPGALIAFIIFTVPEPVRRGLGRLDRTYSGATTTGDAAPGKLWSASYGELFVFMRPRWRFFASHYLGFLFASVAMVGGIGWYAAHMSRHFHWGPGQVGMTLGLMLGIGGISGQLLSGAVIDALYRRGRRDAPLLYFACAALLCAPLGYLAVTSDTPPLFVVALFLYFISVQSMSTCIYAALNLVTPNELRGTGAAFYNATSGLLGAGAGPLLIAMVAQYIYRDEAKLGLAIGTVMVICYPLAALLLAWGMRPMRAAAALPHLPPQG